MTENEFAVVFKHIGDGVYAGWDGYQIELRTNDVFEPDNQVYLNEETLLGLLDFCYQRGILSKA